MIFNAGRRSVDGGLSGIRAAASIAVVAAAVCSVGFLLRATSRNPSQLLVVLMAIWVASPFVALLWASFVGSKLWSAPARVSLYGVMLLVSLSSLAIYEADALWPRGSQAAFVFIAVPPASLIFSAIVVSIAAFISARRSHRIDGV